MQKIPKNVENPEQYSEQCRCSDDVCGLTVDSGLPSFIFFTFVRYTLALKGT